MISEKENIFILTTSQNGKTLEVRERERGERGRERERFQVLLGE